MCGILDSKRKIIPTSRLDNKFPKSTLSCIDAQLKLSINLNYFYLFYHIIWGTNNFIFLISSASSRTLWSKKIIITIPENLPLTDSEKSVLSRGLNFVPIAKSSDEFLVKQDVEKFLRRIQLKAFFHDKQDNSNASDKDMFEKLHVRKSKWTLPEGQFASLDFFNKKCRHDIQKLKFNCHTKFSNLSSEERLALKFLSKRRDIVIKSADKGGAVVVWRSDLYREEALQQLSDTSF